MSRDFTVWSTVGKFWGDLHWKVSFQNDQLCNFGSKSLHMSFNYRIKYILLGFFIQYETRQEFDNLIDEH